MNIDFSGTLGVISDFKPGTYFFTRSNGTTFLGLTTIYGNDLGAVVFNRAFRPDELFPCILTAQFFVGTGLVKLPDAFLAPDVSLTGLHFASEHEDGPGSLTISPRSMFLRVVRRKEAFFYVNVASGEVVPASPGGIEIPRWSIKLTRKSEAVETLFNFDGPKPLP
ncbi:hypothetical protein [Bradyrhizobium guangdongense]